MGEAKGRIMANYFVKGLFDDRVRDVISATPGISAAEALCRASSMAASRRKGSDRGPPARKLPKSRSKEETTSFASTCVPSDVRNVRFAEQDPFFQSSGLVGVEAGETSTEALNPDVSTSESAEVYQPEMYPQYDDGQFATFQSRGGFRGGRGFFRGRGGRLTTPR